jgi:hypothetical protein
VHFESSVKTGLIPIDRHDVFYTGYRFISCPTVSSEIEFLEHNEFMSKHPRGWRATLTVLACGLLGLMGVLAQQVSPEYLKALATVYSGGAVGGFIKDWCDERAPELQSQNQKALEAWRKRMDLPAIDARLLELIGDRKTQVDASLEEQRAGFYAQLDGSSQDPAKDCAELEKSLNADFNLKVLYAEDYKVIAANKGTSQENSGQGNSGQGKGGQGNSSSGGLGAGLLPSGSSGTGNTNSGNTNSGSSTTKGTDKAGSSTTPTTASPLPSIPTFDYAKYAKQKLNPELEPISDEYRCYPELPSSNYAKPQIWLHILPGRKYRAALGKAVFEGGFAVENSSMKFTSGSLAQYAPNKHFFRFDRRYGATITILRLSVGEQEINFGCYQRGASDQVAQLNFKRRDPQPGTYTCIEKDGLGQNAGTLEILPNRQYRFAGTQGKYYANILEDTQLPYSQLEFEGGELEGTTMTYEESEDGFRKIGSLGRGVRVQCTGKGAARPNPKFGPGKAPASGGNGKLQGRYYHIARTTIQGISGEEYQYRFFQKNGYVYTGDAAETEGLAETDCTKIYPSGFPVCEPYNQNGNKLQIGYEEAINWRSIKDGLEIDGGEWYLIEPLDGLSFNGSYSSSSTYTASIGSGGASYYDGLNLRKDGSFAREASSSLGFTGTDNGSATGNPTATVGAASSSAASGKYRVYGNTIEFKYQNGRIERQFAFLPGGRKDLEWIRIGDASYFKDKP